MDEIQNLQIGRNGFFRFDFLKQAREKYFFVLREIFNDRNAGFIRLAA
jgi:hypothetical protein